MAGISWAGPYGASTAARPGTQRRGRALRLVALAAVVLVALAGAVVGLMAIARGRRAAAYVGHWREVAFVSGEGRTVTLEEAGRNWSLQRVLGPPRPLRIDVAADRTCVVGQPTPMLDWLGWENSWALGWRIDWQGNLVVLADPSPRMVFSLSRDKRTLIYHPGYPGRDPSRPHEGDMLLNREAEPAARP